MLLAIDTSTAYTGVACYEDNTLLGEVAWFSGRDHTTQLLPQITLLMRNLGRPRSAVSAVAVAIGPGSWSGLRVGVSTAKGFALANQLPLIGICTLDALAYQFARPGLPVCPIIRLGRERFASASYADQPPWQRAGDIHNHTLAEIGASVEGRMLFCGDIDAEVRTALQRLHGDAAQFPAPAAALRRPGFLAELAWARWQAGDTDDLATLEPIYLGHPVKS